MSEIVHKGVVQRAKNGEMEVEIIDGVECESCSIKGACSMGESREKLVSIDAGQLEFREGDTVSVHLSSGLAFSALFWAYIFPFIVLFGGLVALSFFFNEAIAGLISLVFLVVYYGFIYMNRTYFDRKFSLKINRLKND